MRALSIRQPWAEMILRGDKTVEYRSRATHIIGEEFYIYAAKGKSQEPAARRQNAESRGQLPTGIIVGTAVISHCTQNNGHWEWHLTQVRRLARPRRPARMPQPVWFRPF